MAPNFWRQWHRWIALPATLFLCFAAVTGVIVAGTEFFGAEEALREATRDLVSPMTLGTPFSEWSAKLDAALATVSAQSPGELSGEMSRPSFLSRATSVARICSCSSVRDSAFFILS